MPHQTEMDAMATSLSSQWAVWYNKGTRAPGAISEHIHQLQLRAVRLSQNFFLAVLRRCPSECCDKWIHQSSSFDGFLYIFQKLLDLYDYTMANEKCSPMPGQLIADHGSL